MAKPILVVMAAGMGSRYGGLKQIDPVGSHGEAILDYSIYDAYQAGFETTVVIIKEAIKEDFMQTVGVRLAKTPMEIRYAYQELDDLPQGYAVPEGRVKPWGTSHAVLCAAKAIGDAPFVVVNADDYYGKSAFRTIFQAMSQDDAPYSYYMVGYEVSKTVTDNGGVTRGVCKLDDNRFLTRIDECYGIEKHEGGIRYPAPEGGWIELAPDTTVSMNILGFKPSFIKEIQTRFPKFLDKALATNPMKGEFVLPMMVEELISEKTATMKVLSSEDRWYGVTYSGDKPAVVAALRRMTQEGMYPDGLWD